MIGRAIYIWRLKPVLDAEGGVQPMIEKARRAKLSALWIKVAEGASGYSQNVGGSMEDTIRDVIKGCHDEGIEVWGWHVPRCPTGTIAKEEAKNFGEIVDELGMDGLIMDAEGGEGFFQGGVEVAEIYASKMQSVKDDLAKPLGVSSHDIPQNIAGWLPKFNEIASVADFNFPQVYYGGSPSVLHRLTRAEDGNSHLTIPFVPVGAAWVGSGGGCESASACAERAREFIRLVNEHGYQGYSFWHWHGAPSSFWEVLNTTEVA
jgi:hypothetical protein